MNRIRRSILSAICLLLVTILLATTGQVWASAIQQPAPVSAQMQAAQAAISLLLMEDDDNQDSGFKYHIFLPLVKW